LVVQWLSWAKSNSTNQGVKPSFCCPFVTANQIKYNAKRCFTSKQKGTTNLGAIFHFYEATKETGRHRMFL